MPASHLPPECEFRVRVQVQLVGGETREIPGDTECHELALDLNGRRMAKFVLWVQSEQECYLCVTNRDSNGAVAALVPNPRLDGSKPFIVLANHPPARVPPERQDPPEQQTPVRRLPSQQPTRSLSLTVRPPEDRSKLEPRSATKSYNFAVTQGALYEVRHGCPLCACELDLAMNCETYSNAMLQDFELAFFPRCVHVRTLDVGCEHPPATPIDDLNRQRQGSAGSPPISQPACSYQRKVVLRLYVCDTSTSA